MTATDRFTIVPAARFDLAQTQKLYDLFAIPREQRDDTWGAAFQAAAWNASVTVPAPQPFAGPDGFPYLRLAMPPVAQAFESNCLSNLCAQCAEQGWGAAFFADAAAGPEATQYAISTGILDSLSRFASWDGDPVDVAESADDDGTTASHATFPAARRVLIATPSPDYLPCYTAAALGRHLAATWQLAEPRVALLVDSGLQPTRNLVIGKKLSEFPDEETADHQVRRLLWYLPPLRSLVLMPEDWTLDQLTPLSRLAG